MTLVVVILLALVLFAYAAVPLLLPRQADPLPDMRDPVELDLEEERDALFRAIKELELREDLPQERRGELRARYEAKAAKVLRALDERQAELAGQAPVKRAPSRGRLPYGVLSLLGVALITSIVMSQYVLPRVGTASITASFNDDIEAAEGIRDLQRAVNRDPSVENRLALAQGYWQLEDAETAKEIYTLISEDSEDVPAIAYQRLGYLTLEDDFNGALSYFEQARAADPSDLDTLYALGELYYSQARPDDAEEVFESFLALPEGAGDAEVEARLSNIREVRDTLNEATTNPNEDSLLALADTYWNQEEFERASDIYVNVLSEFNPHSALAFSRIGQTLFFAGQNEEAIEILNRALEVNAEDLDTLLFLGNAHFTLGQYDEAIQTWESYVAVTGEEAAGRVPGLIENARAQLASSEPREDSGAMTSADATPSENPSDEAELVQVSGSELYATNCAACHGENGGGGTGPRLVGNARAADTANVSNIVQYGRGAMPGFGAILSEEELEAVISYTERLASDQASER